MFQHYEDNLPPTKQCLGSETRPLQERYQKLVFERDRKGREDEHRKFLERDFTDYDPIPGTGEQKEEKYIDKTASPVRTSPPRKKGKVTEAEEKAPIIILTCKEMTDAQIKTELKQYGAKHTGTRVELCRRLAYHRKKHGISPR